MTILIFLLILSILVLVHELGHFIVAKLAKVKVEEFGIGFPPRIITVRYGETVYSINALLFGGFVRLYGEEEPVGGFKKSIPQASRMFRSKSKKVRAGIIAAGVLMNFLLAILVFSIIYSIVGIPRKTDTVRVIGILPESPAQQAGIVVDDVLFSVYGEKIYSTDQFKNLIEDRKGKAVTLEIQKGNEEIKKIEVVPRPDPPKGEGPLGVVITDTEQYFPPLWQRPFLGVAYGLQEALLWGEQTVIGVVLMFTTLFTQGKVPEGIAGPVGIFQITGEVAQQGNLALLHFMGVLSVNLAILNFLPIPALDGGRMMFVVLEAIFRGRARAIIPKVERLSNTVGFTLLVALLISITLQDIRRLLGQ